MKPFSGPFVEAFSITLDAVGRTPKYWPYSLRPCV
jgi:hypothetical protein